METNYSAHEGPPFVLILDHFSQIQSRSSYTFFKIVLNFILSIPEIIPTLGKL
jgi:lipopolysaccharide export LptBFGC system permease protein LptF